MKLYNTLSRSLETFAPQHDKKVSFYSCGPTVYDYPHIGNWYAFIRWDTLTRALRSNGYDVTWVMNITDVGHLVSDADEGEDKLEKGARREGKTAWEVAQFYTDVFLDGMTKLNFTMPDTLPKATDHITEQIELVKTLESKGYTYTIDDGVYFDVTKFPKYADFAKLNLDELVAGARIGENTDKKHPADFALWKFSPSGEKRDMEWDSPWGKGFPGWHIECSAMSMKYLGKTLDIHAGGIDHIPVHHTNEIAQSEASTDTLFSKYWVHGNFILVDGKKMSKSLGNFYTLSDISNKGYRPLEFRLLVLESHYQSEAQFSWDSLTAAKNRLEAYEAMADLRWQQLGTQSAAHILDDGREAIQNAINENLNTPLALSILSEVAASLADNPPSNDDDFQEFLTFIDSIFGLQLSGRADITKEQKALLKNREQARQDKNWQLSDELRDNLKLQGISVRDTAYGQVWSRRENQQV